MKYKCKLEVYDGYETAFVEAESRVNAIDKFYHSLRKKGIANFSIKLAYVFIQAKRVK